MASKKEQELLENNAVRDAIEMVWDDVNTILDYEDGDFLSRHSEVLMVAGLKLHMAYGGITPSPIEDSSQYSGTLREYRKNAGFEELISYLEDKKELSYTEREILDEACQEEYGMSYAEYKEYSEEQESHEEYYEESDLASLRDDAEEKEEALAELSDEIDSRQKTLLEIEGKYQALQDEMDKKDGKRGVNR